MQLLLIKSVPMKYTLRTQQPHLEIRQPKSAMKLNVQPAKLKLQSEPIKVRLDTFAARESIGLKTAATMSADNAQKGLAAADKATAEYSEIGSQMAKAYKGVSIPDIMYNKLFEQPTTHMVFLPSVGPQISWQANKLDVEYQPGFIDTKFDTKPVAVDYIPGEITIEIEQYNKLEIEYLGDHFYVPPSSNPNFDDKIK